MDKIQQVGVFVSLLGLMLLWFATIAVIASYVESEFGDDFAYAVMGVFITLTGGIIYLIGGAL